MLVSTHSTVIEGAHGLRIVALPIPPREIATSRSVYRDHRSQATPPIRDPNITCKKSIIRYNCFSLEVLQYWKIITINFVIEETFFQILKFFTFSEKIRGAYSIRVFLVLRLEITF